MGGTGRGFGMEVRKRVRRGGQFRGLRGAQMGLSKVGVVSKRKEKGHSCPPPSR